MCAALFLLEATAAEIENMNNDLERFFKASTSHEAAMVVSLARDAIAALRSQGITSLNAIAFVEDRLAELERRVQPPE